LQEKLQPSTRDLCGELANDNAPLDKHGDRRQRHADRRNTCGCIFLCLVAHQAVVGIGAMQIVQQRRELQPGKILLGRHPVQFGVCRQQSRHG